MTRKSSLFVLDPALVGLEGHHFNYNAAIRDECARRGIPVRILANERCGAGVAAALQATPCFTFTTYDQPQLDGYERLIGAHLAQNVAIGRDLGRSGAQPGPDDVILFHTVTAHQLTGLWQWYRTLPEPRPAVVAQFMFPPWFQAEDADRDAATVLLLRAMRVWLDDPGSRIAFAADSRELAGFLAGLAGGPIDRLPMPIAFPALPGPKARAPAGPLRFAFLGEPRPEKGFAELIGALCRYRRPLAVPVQFVIQASRFLDDAMVAALRQALPGDELVAHAVTEQDYWQMIADSDAVLIPYDPEAYAMRSSRILIEAVGMAKPVLVTAGSWMERELAELGGAGVAVPHTSEGIWRGIEQSAAQPASVSAVAHAAAAVCRARNSPSRYLDAVFELAGAGLGLRMPAT